MKLILNKKLTRLIKGVTLLSSLLLSACSFSGGEIPADHYYRLPVAGINTAIAGKLKNNIASLLVEPVQADGLYHERSILYVESATPLELGRYHYHYWVEPPAILIRKHIHSALEGLGINSANANTVSPSKMDVSLTSRILGFERLVNGSDSEVLVKLKLGVRYGSNPDKDWSRQYLARLAVPSQSMHDTVATFGRALDQVLAAFFSDLAINNK
ncbi:MAG: ABC-type transport auxiliary lipoprotein family protein [Gammaproteobacteria bacterium]|nr:ABC-type transport auxiliary lipoprotein family protein [Gammaproteobacteria bacterium]